MATGFARETGFTYDTLLELQTSTTDTSAAQSSVVDLGGAGAGDNEDSEATTVAACVIDISAIEIASNDELFTFTVVGSDNSDFSTGDQEDLASLELGANEVLNGDVDSDTGRYVLHFSTHRNTRKYRYVRLELTVAGTIATGITWAAYIAKAKNA